MCVVYACFPLWCVCIHMCVGACVCAHACGGWRLTLGVPSNVLMLIYLWIRYFTDHGAHQFGQTCLSPRGLPASTSPAWELQVCAAVLGIFVGSMGWNSSLCVCVISTLWLAHLPSPQKTLSIHSFTEWTLWFWGRGGLTHNVWCLLGVTCPPKAPALEAGIVVIFGGGNIWGVGPHEQRLSHGHLKGLNLVWGLLDLVRVT